MTTGETAEVLGITEANVKIRLNRARAMLRKRLNVYYNNVYKLPLPHCDAIVKKVFSHLGI